MQISVPQPIQSNTAPRDAWAPWLDADSEKAVTAEDWWLWINGIPYCVPAGYVTDWASIPSVVHWLYPPDKDTFRPAALYHDYCYSHLWPLVSKAYADKAFREILKACGVPWWRRWIFWSAVRLGGKGGWHRVKEPDADPFWGEQYAKMVA